MTINVNGKLINWVWDTLYIHTQV